MNPFSGKVALVTGASAGIGRACATLLARQGASVALLARHAEPLEQLAAELQREGARTLCIAADVADRASASAAIRQTLDALGGLDILVANAGIYPRAPIRELSLDDLERVMAVNFYGAAGFVFGALPHMLERGSGHLVVVSSVDGKKGIPPDGAYAASKYALTGFAEVLRQELHGSGVHLTVVCPGRVDTRMVAGLDVPAISAKVPPERVARAIVRGIRRRSPEVIVPWWGAKTLIVLNALYAGLGDALVRLLRLSGMPRNPS